LLDHAGPDLRHHVLGREVLVDIDPQPIGGQIADVAEARPHHIPRPEILLDRPGLGGGLDDDEGLGHRSSLYSVPKAGARPSASRAAGSSSPKVRDLLEASVFGSWRWSRTDSARMARHGRRGGAR
jgi:hypothetical protein